MRDLGWVATLGWLFAAVGIVLIVILVVASAVSVNNQQLTIPKLDNDTTISTPAVVTDLSEVANLQTQMANVYAASVTSVVQLLQDDGTVGSGWVFGIDPTNPNVAYIVTNFHVVQSLSGNYGNYLCSGPFELSVKYYGNTYGRGCVVGFDTSGDIAVVRVERAGLEPLPLSTLKSVKPGHFAFALGEPFGNDFTITLGIVSQVGRLLDSGGTRYSVGAVIQTDAALNPGNSGGPLLDIYGRVIGVNTQIQTNSGQNAGIGFAIPVDLVNIVATQIIEQGSYTYPYLGISASTSAPGLEVRLASLGFDDPSTVGSLVSNVLLNGPAYTGGLHLNDLITGVALCQPPDSFGGCANQTLEPVSSIADLIGLINLYAQPGDWIVVDVVRAVNPGPDSELRVGIELGSRPPA